MALDRPQDWPRQRHRNSHGVLPPRDHTVWLACPTTWSRSGSDTDQSDRRELLADSADPAASEVIRATFRKAPRRHLETNEGGGTTDQGQQTSKQAYVVGLLRI